MELKQILNILRRRWWLVAVPGLVALVAALAGVLTQPTEGYTSTMRFMVATPLTGNPIDYEDAVALGVGALVDWSATSSFADAVNGYLSDTPYSVEAGAFVADTTRSMLALSVTRPTPEGAEAVMRAAAAALEEQAAHYYPYEGGVTVTPLDDLQVQAASPGLLTQLDPLIRLMIGGAAGVGLAFLAHYLDPTLYDRAEAEATGFDILAEVPRSS